MIPTIPYSLLSCVFAVGEPLNDEAWLWYHNVVGDGRCTVVDTWWQTGVVSRSMCTCIYMYLLSYIAPINQVEILALLCLVC